MLFFPAQWEMWVRRGTIVLPSSSHLGGTMRSIIRFAPPSAARTAQAMVHGLSARIEGND